jgi:hypothetical protein
MGLEKKRYVLFGYLTYYPSGGMDDAMISFDTKKELIEESSRFSCDYYDVFDTETFKTGSGGSPEDAFKNLED